MIYIGIDTGTQTGFAVWSHEQRKVLRIETMAIHQAMAAVLDYINEYGPENVFVRYEDPKQRKWFGPNAEKKKIGAGYVRRDSTVWKGFLSDNKIPFAAIHPLKGLTKMTAEQFEKYTGWKKRTSEHARDAAMLVFEM